MKEGSYEPSTQGRARYDPWGVSKGRKMNEEIGEGSSGHSCGQIPQP